MKGPAFGGSFFCVLRRTADFGFGDAAVPHHTGGQDIRSVRTSNMLFPVKKPGWIATLGNGSLASCIMDGTTGLQTES